MTHTISKVPKPREPSPILHLYVVMTFIQCQTSLNVQSLWKSYLWKTNTV